MSDQSKPMRPNKKYTVFISSTYDDLQNERAEVMKACLKMGHIPIGMEMFNAGNATQWEVIRRTIDDCDYYIVILADRYGTTIDSEGGISYTEKEYDYAISQSVPVIGLVMHKGAEWPGTKRETDRAKQDRLDAFRKKVESKIVSHWKDKNSLGTEFVVALSSAFVTDPRPGWIPSTEAAVPETANEIARLSSENERLRSQLESARASDEHEVRFAKIASELGSIPSAIGPKSHTLFDLLTEVIRDDAHGVTAAELADRLNQPDLEKTSHELDKLACWELLNTTFSEGYYQITELARQLLRWKVRQELLNAAKPQASATRISPPDEK